MRDKIKKFLAYNGKISVICAETTEMVEEARKIHDMSPVVTAAFGRVLTITAIMATEMKGSKDKLTVQIKGTGEIEKPQRIEIDMSDCIEIEVLDYDAKEKRKPKSRAKIKDEMENTRQKYVDR